MHVLKIKYQFE